MGDFSAADARQAVDEVIGGLKALRSKEVRIERETLIEILSLLRGWIKDDPAPAPFKHMPFSARRLGVNK